MESRIIAKCAEKVNLIEMMKSKKIRDGILSKEKIIIGLVIRYEAVKSKKAKSWILSK